MIKRLEQMAKRFAEVNEQIQDPELVKDPKKYKDIMREHSHLSSVMEAYEEYKTVLQGIEDAKVLITEEEDHDMKEMAREELKGLEEKKPQIEEKIKFLLIPPDPLEEKNIIMEIRGGTGGDESSLFAADLFRMYTRYADMKGWKYEIMDANETEVGGYKEISLSISGKYVYGSLRYESGVHRVQRVPETEAQGRVHTSAVTVAVLPEAEETEIDIKPEDVRVDVMRAGGPGGQCVNTTDSAVRLTHIPTGIVVIQQDEKSQIKNKAKAWRVLRARLFDLEESKKNAERAAARRNMVGSGDRSERIRTYNFPQNRLTDHRINLTLYKLDQVMQGQLDELIDALCIYNKEALLKADGSALS
ncbi:MAG: peptide chain release factor 1 [Spirochaetaceae bacterium]|nr:peptide chain release factor 1 [Spirochaetaceae bacterium]MBO4728108.1 peptide chain release factor 1 [Spirochaetaceae bacterium]MBR4826205.1 peptide chain release factor 1 [Spirochaetaceae bacterium]